MELSPSCPHCSSMAVLTGVGLSGLSGLPASAPSLLAPGIHSSLCHKVRKCESEVFLFPMQRIFSGPVFILSSCQSNPILIRDLYHNRSSALSHPLDFSKAPPPGRARSGVEALEASQNRCSKVRVGGRHVNILTGPNLLMVFCPAAASMSLPSSPNLFCTSVPSCLLSPFPRFCSLS